MRHSDRRFFVCGGSERGKLFSQSESLHTVTSLKPVHRCSLSHNQKLRTPSCCSLSHAFTQQNRLPRWQALIFRVALQQVSLEQLLWPIHWLLVHVSRFILIHDQLSVTETTNSPPSLSIPPPSPPTTSSSLPQPSESSNL